MNWLKIKFKVLCAAHLLGGIISCPIWLGQAATAIIGSSQSLKAKSGYNTTTQEAAIPVFFGFIQCLSVVTEPPNYSSL